MLTALCEYQWYCNHEDLTEGHFQRYILDVVETRPSKQKVTATDLKKALKHVTMKAKGDVNHRVMENVYDSITNHYLWQPLEETETRKVFVRAVTEIMPLELADQVRENYEGAQDQFDPVDNADEFEIAAFFPGVPIQGLMHYPPVVDFAQVSAVQQRLKKMLQRGSALEDLVAMALVLLRHMHAYDMSEQSWTEYKSFVRQEDARFNAARWRPAWGACQSVHDPTRRRLSMLQRLSKKSDSAFYKTFNTFSRLVEDIAQFASACLNAPRLHYDVVRDLVMGLARPRFTEEVMAQTFVPIDRNAGYAHTASRSPTPESTRHRSRSRDRG
ncbi:unnamed protein product [Aphanomyces euteiches]